jgi:precorrin-8X/cobalt-precorrin-8 methylmutase
MELMSVHLRPEEIEAESFRIIDMEAGEHSWPLPEWPVVRRVIHTTADFEYANTMSFSPDAVRQGIEAIRNGRGVVTDTNMALAGINRRLLARFKITASCFVADPKVSETAAQAGTTRSIMAMRKGVSEPRNGIFVIGNAPTALFELLRLTREEGLRPDLVIGLPVGFVGAKESKEQLIREAAARDIPFISNHGRKGGSNVAAAVMNALLLLAAGEDDKKKA